MATVSWNNSNGNWNTGSNWSTSTVPGGSDDAVLDGSSVFYGVTINAPITAVNSLNLSNGGAELSVQRTTTGLTTGNLTNTGTVAVDNVSGQGGSVVTIGGTLVNSSYVAIGTPNLSASTTVSAAALANTGTVYVSGNYNPTSSNSATLDITSGAAPSTLTGSLQVHGNALIEFAGGQITSIAQNSSLVIDGHNAFVADAGATNSNSAIAINQNAGSFELDAGSSANLGGPITNTGNLTVGGFGTGYAGATSLTATSLQNTGTVTLNSGGFSPQSMATIDIAGAAPAVLTGTFNFSSDSYTSNGMPQSSGPEVLEFASGSIQTIAPGATLSMQAANAYVADASNPNANGALSGLSLNAGTWRLYGSSAALSGNLVNIGETDVIGGNLSVAGTLTNFGTLKDEIYYSNTSSVVTLGGLANYGSGSVFVVGKGTTSAVLDINAAAPTTLTGQYSIGVDYFGGINGPALLEFASGGITTIGAGASLVFGAPNAFVADAGATNSSSALANLSLNEGELLLKQGSSLTTNTGLINLAALDVDDPHYGGSTLSIGGPLESFQTIVVGATDSPAPSLVSATGLLNYGSISLYGSSATNTGTLQINGNASDYGAITINRNSAFNVTGTFSQYGNLIPIAGSLNAGAVNLAGGEINLAATLSAPTVNLTGGVLEGLGTVVGNVNETAGLIYGGTLADNYSYNYGFYDPGVTGTLTINGNFSETGASVVDVLRGTSTVSASTIAVTGGVTLNGGMLQVDSGAGSNSYGVTFAAGETFTVMTFAPGQLTGSFAGIQDANYIGNGNNVDIGGGLTLQIVYNNSAGNIQLQVINTPAPASGDVVVDSGNYSIGAPTNISGSLIFASPGTLSIVDPAVNPWPHPTPPPPVYTPMTVTVGGNLSNAGQMAVDVNGPYYEPGGTVLSVGGTLDNGGNLTIGNGGGVANTTVIAAALDNTGTLNLFSDSGPNGTTLSTLDITGPAGFGFAGTVTGYANVYGNDAATGPVLIEFGSGQITTVALGATLSLHGAGAIIADAGNTGSNSALVGLSDIAGNFSMVDGSSVTTNTGMIVTGSVAVDNSGPYAVSGGSSLTIGGVLTNMGSVTVGNGSMGPLYTGGATGPSTLTVQGVVNNSKLSINGGANEPATMVVHSAAGFGVAGVLTGTVQLYGNDAANGHQTIEFDSGQITTIAGGSSLSENGPNAFVADAGSISSNSALVGLSAIGGGGGPTGAGFGGGSLALQNGAAVATNTDMLNAGAITVDYAGPYQLGGGSSLAIGGTLTNQGGVTIGTGSITAAANMSAAGLINTGNITVQGNTGAGGATGTLTINGAATNSGTITVDGKGLIVVNGNLTEYGTINLNGGTLDVNGTIGGTGGVSFSNTGGELVLASSTTLPNTIYGFAAGDVIDLRGVSGGSAGSFTLSAGNVLTVNEGSNSYALQLNPSQSFAGLAFTLTGDGSGGTLVGLESPAVMRSDMNADAVSDLVMTNNNTGALVLDEVSGGQMGYQYFGALGPEWQFDGTGAFLGDGREGFLLWNANSGGIVVGENVGGGAQYTPIGGVGSEWQFEGTGGFTGSGNTGFLLYNTINGGLAVGQYSGGSLQYSNIGGLGSEWRFEGTGNYLGDNKTGFLIYDSNNGTMAVGEDNNGAAGFTVVGGLGSEWQFVGTGNFLGHGQDDFLIRDSNNGALYAGEVRSGAVQYTALGGLGSEWQFFGTGNYDGTSNAEFMLHNGNTGALVVGGVSQTTNNGTITYGVNYTPVGGIGSEWNFHVGHIATVA